LPRSALLRALFLLRDAAAKAVATVSFAFPSPLYAIADPGESARDVVAIARELLAGGARLVQLRWKQASSRALLSAATECRRLTRSHGALFLVNDRVDVALACDADGAHLGQGDLPIAAARKLLGPSRAIGVSTHDLEQARRAAEHGADYIGFGPMFATASKATGYAARGREALGLIRGAVKVPIVAIGGIREGDAAEVIRAGADAVAMISELTAADDVAAKVRSVIDRLEPLDSTRPR
jgi:thiamine-phosphate pyrophosphorylase